MARFDPQGLVNILAQNQAMRIQEAQEADRARAFQKKQAYDEAQMSRQKMLDARADRAFDAGRALVGDTIGDPTVFNAVRQTQQDQIAMEDSERQRVEAERARRAAGMQGVGAFVAQAVRAGAPLDQVAAMVQTRAPAFAQMLDTDPTAVEDFIGVMQGLDPEVANGILTALAPQQAQGSQARPQVLETDQGLFVLGADGSAQPVQFDGATLTKTDQARARGTYRTTVTNPDAQGVLRRTEQVRDAATGELVAEYDAGVDPTQARQASGDAADAVGSVLSEIDREIETMDRAIEDGWTSGLAQSALGGAQELLGVELDNSGIMQASISRIATLRTLELLNIANLAPVSNAEVQLLRRAALNLNTSVSPAEFTRRYEKFKAQYEKTRAVLARDPAVSGAASPTSGASTTPRSLSDMSDAELEAIANGGR